MLALFTSFSITFLVNVWFERGHIARSGLVVPLASVRFASRFCNSFWSGFNSHNF